MRRRGVAHTQGTRRSRSRLILGLALGGIACAAAAAVVVWALPDSAPGDTGSAEIPADPSKSEILVDRPFQCVGEVDLDLVRVTMRTPVEDAISLDENCTGRIGRIEVETWTADGIKVQNHGSVAHDLVIESGFVKCHAIAGEYHQDGIQVMGGHRITFRNLRVDCLGNANLFLAEGGQLASTPTDVVCEGCVLGPNSAQTLFYADSIRSGVRGTTICTGRFRAIRVEPEAQSTIREESEVLPGDHPSCEDVTGKGAS